MSCTKIHRTFAESLECVDCMTGRTKGEINRLRARVKELEEGIKQLFLLIDNADPAAWRNGNEAYGRDEGEVMAMEMISALREKLSWMKNNPAIKFRMV